jgi:uncharacterized protein YlaI
MDGTHNPVSVTFICPECGDRISHQLWTVECSCGYLRTDRGQIMSMPVKNR